MRRQAAVELMAAEYESDQVEVEWRDPTEEETVKAMKDAKGSGGVDGWVGEEIKYLPEQVANSFRKLAMRWQQAQQVADALKETRQANLTKPGKVKNGGLEAGDTRPINVECIWWRIWGTAWVKSQPVAEWRKTNIPEEVLGGAGSKGAEEAGADICDDVAQQGFGGTLDFSLCYDHKHLEVTCELMRRAGWPRRITDLCKTMWSGQRRWLAWNGHVAPEPMEASEAMPQGDPFGPIALNIWMGAGTRWVNRESEAKEARTRREEEQEEEEEEEKEADQDEGRNQEQQPAAEARTRRKSKAEGGAEHANEEEAEGKRAAKTRSKEVNEES